ncbi:MAG: class I SAM-dependent methyltransferase [Caldilineaceae bacterium]
MNTKSQAKVHLAKNIHLREQYQQVNAGNHWSTWPVIRHWRTLRWRRLQPLGGGRSTGLSIIRYYWADFLQQHQGDIQGHALEIGETTTIRQYGGDRLTQADALDLAAHTSEVKVVADLSRADHVSGNRYDCFVVPFTTAVIYDLEAFVYHALRLLRPGGVLLINFWCVDFYLHRGLDMGTAPKGHPPLYMYHWSTPIEIHNLLHSLALTPTDYSLQVYGNLVARMAFLLNVPARELTKAEREHVDPGQPLLICARIVKPIGWSPPKPAYRDPLWTPATVPAQISQGTGHYGDEYG